MNRFWDWRTRPNASVGAQVAVAETTLEPVELYTESAMITGLVASEGRRLSDILNTNSHLPVRNPKSVSMVDGLEGEQGDGWSGVDVPDILLVMPPAHSPARQLKIHRRQHRVRIVTGPFEVSGTAHVLPGVALDPYVLRSRMNFIALTDARVYVAGDQAWERTAPVVLVNVRPVKDLIEVMTIT